MAENSSVLADGDGMMADADVSSARPELKSGFKSWRKKYRKMMLDFDEKMEESSSLYDCQHKTVSLARRLQEQNDQLLELLLDINQSDRLPDGLKLNLDLSSNTNGPYDNNDEVSVEEVYSAFRKAQKVMDSGRIDKDIFQKTEKDLVTVLSVNSARRLGSLCSLPHTRYHSSSLQNDIFSEPLLGYMTPTHEEDYLKGLDVDLNDGTNAYRTGLRPVIARPPCLLPLKDFSIQNPNSVYNWLKRNQPQVFLQDREQESGQEKSSARSSKKSGAKRPTEASTVSVKNDSEAFDEDPVPVSEPANGTLKGKKSRDDDAYRPKGGNSRSSKRKREDGEKNSRSKKPKLPMTGLDDQQDNKYNTRDGDYVQSAMDDGDT